ncbi:hypothetical protein [Ottowia thiooxydans]|uniref:hypothetical protein n=1 Tax=Ottowia thiooxydans TaxID=219182 RepID=UPI001B7FD897|nr:hypothetical protein [Ottowia thiooxydans]
MKLGSHSLNATEVALIRMLLRLYAHGGKSRWTYVEAPPYDVLLVDASSGNVALPQESPDQIAKRVLRLTRDQIDEDMKDALPRPLCSQKLREWLDGVESALAAPTETTVLAAETAKTQTSLAETPTVETPTVEMPAATPSPLAPVQAREESEPEDHGVSRPFPEEALPSENEPRYRLQRWPRQGILRGDPGRIRMATLLTRRALNSRDLVNLTGFSPHECQVFMQVLHASSLLLPLQPVAAQGKAGSNAQSRPVKQSFTSSLISGLRKRLGL